MKYKWVHIRALRLKLKEKIVSSIHPLSTAYPVSGRSDWGTLRLSQASAEMWSVHLDLGLSRSILPAGRAWNTSTGRQPGCIHTRCPNHLSWLKRSSASTPSSSQMTELLTVSLSETPATLLVCRSTLWWVLLDKNDVIFKKKCRTTLYFYVVYLESWVLSWTSSYFAT